MENYQWDALRDFVENLWKAVVNLLSKLGEWPLDLGL